jgi:rhodanese-related sulfurtransferase
MFLEFVQQQWPLFAALVIIVLSLIYSYVGDRLMGYTTVDPNQATRLINDGAALLDVRSEAEYKSGHIADALNIPVSQLKSRLDKLGFSKADPVVVYCQSGSRSARACALLAKNGYEKVYNLGGGIMAWQSAGMPVSKGKLKSRKKKTKKS